jgi:uncharacterized membrane protein
VVETPRSIPAPVVVVAFDMPFWQLVGFLVKLAIAAIPAAIIISIVFWALALLLVFILRTSNVPGYGIH